MTQTINLSNLDVIFISYDEPVAEYHWAKVLEYIPWAQRVHGIKGSDAAHKAAANLSSTERFITIDADNFLTGNILDQKIEIDDNKDISKSVLSWPAYNSINGLLYGNGGIKCWPKNVVLNMKTHESADPSNIRAQIDFCWDIDYIPFDKCYSEIVNNASPKQAWRAGFREGVKMVLKDGLKVEAWDNIPSGNLNRLLMWMTVGEDVRYGKWAIYGARMGCYLTHFTDWDYTQVRDFDFLDMIWDAIENLTITEVDEKIADYGNRISKQFNLPLPFSASHSTFFKKFCINPDRQPSYISSCEIKKNHYDIVMITYGEENAEINWKNLKARFPRAIRVDGIKGIHQAHQVAASKCSSEMFWVVDGDAVIHDSFKFDYEAEQKDTVYVWRAENPINGLVYGYGAVKLLPRQKVLDMDLSNPDMTTSISNSYKVIHMISNVTKFDTSALSVWRSAFRECAKLASNDIPRSYEDETLSRLNIWTSFCGSHFYNSVCLSGAKAGEKYGKENKGNKLALSKINDFEWLKEQYARH